MRFDIKGNPSYGEVDVDLGPNETILIEPGAMSRMSSNLNSSFQRQGGFFSAMLRKMFGGESFFLGKYEHPDGGKLTFAPASPGSVQHYKLSNNNINIMAGAFLACTPAFFETSSSFLAMNSMRIFFVEKNSIFFSAKIV